MENKSQLGIEDDFHVFKKPKYICNKNFYLNTTLGILMSYYFFISNF